MSGVLASTEQECVVTLTHPAVGSLTFHEADGAPKDLPFALSLLAGEETSFGNPVPMVEVIESLIAEGAQAYVQGWENRVFALTLRCEADSGEALAQFEDTLMRIILAAGPGSMATLRYVPPARESAPTNFDVQTLTLKRVLSDRWDLDESRRLTRYWQVEFTTLPFVRPDEPVVIEASPLPVDPGTGVTYETVTATSSWTGWTGDGIPSNFWTATPAKDLESGSFIRVTATKKPGVDKDARLRARRDTGNANASAWPLIKVVTKRVKFGASSRIQLSFDGAARQDAIANVRSGDLVASWFEAPVGGWSSSLAITALIGNAPTDGPYRFTVVSVEFTDGIDAGTGTTSREQSRILAVPGAAPTSARLALYSDEDAGGLGETVLIHTSNDEATFSPPLRPYRLTSATVTTDSTLVSGASNSLSSATQWLIPASQLLAGTYALVARMKRTTGATTRNLNWSAKLADAAGADLPLGSDITVSGSTPVTLTGTGWQPVAIASMTLPPVGVDVSAAYVLVSLSMSSDGADVLIDQGWLLDTTRGAFTLLYLPGTAATSASWVECRSPDLGAPFWQVYGGTGGSAKEAGQDFGRFALALGRHRFLPGDLTVFTVTSGASRSQSRGEMYARHHSHVTYGAEQTTTPGA